MNDELIVFIWRAKVAGAHSDVSHALAPTARTIAMCGTGTARDTHWVEERAEQERCRSCVETIGGANYARSDVRVDSNPFHDARLTMAQSIVHVFESTPEAERWRLACTAAGLDLDLYEDMVRLGYEPRRAYGDLLLTENLRSVRGPLDRIGVSLDCCEGCNACPVCGLHGGFHDHGEVGSRHDAHEVPRHLIMVSERAERVRLTDQEIAERREVARQRREAA